MKIDLTRSLIFLTGAACGVAAFVYLGGAFRSTSTIQDFFVTIYSILVGFLVAVMAVILDPGVVLRGSWRIAHLQRAEMRKRFYRHIFIFYTYLITLVFVFILKIDKWMIPGIETWIGKFAAFFAVSSLIWSFDLPISLFNIQRDKFDAIVDSRKSGDNNK